MMESIEFTVKVEHLSILKENFSKIQDVFHDVELKIEDSETKNTTKHDWVTVVGENKEICKKTKDYIVSLTNPEKIILKDISESFYKIVTSEESDLLKVIERETSVSLKLLCKTCLKIQSYDEVSAVIAESIIDEKNKSKSSKNNNETIEHIGVDENLQNFAFKLGYDKEDILKASKNIIQKQLKLNENTLLQELVNSCPEKLKDKVIHFENVTEKQISNMTECKNVSGLREIVIDGSNVAMCHGNKEIFSCRGIEIVVDWFLKRGHTKVFAFVPQWRLENPKPDSPILNQEILKKLERDHRLIFTPSRNINGRRVACYDDRFIVKYAYENDGIIVSNDHFRDLQKESTEWKIFLEQHLLMFAFVQNSFMPPDDPLGRSGPTLSEFLRKGSVLSKACPYRNKCTYGTKCRFYHPQSTQEKEHEKNAKRLNELLNPSENNKHKSEFDLGNNCSVISNKVHYRVDRSLHKEVVSHRQAPPLNCGLQMRMHAPSTDFELSEHDVIARGTSQRKSAVIDNDDVKGNHPHHKESFIDPRYPRHPTDYMTSYSRNDERFTSPSYTTNMQRENYNMSSTMGGGNSYMASPYEKYPPPPRYDTAPVSSLTLGASGQSFSQNPYVYNLTPALHPSYTPTQTNIPFDSMTPHNYHQHYYNQNPIPVTPFAMQRTHLLQQQITPSHTPTPLRSNMKPNIQTSIDEHLFQMLLKMFPGQQRRIQNVLYKYPGERNVDKLYHYITSQP